MNGFWRGASRLDKPSRASKAVEAHETSWSDRADLLRRVDFSDWHSKIIGYAGFGGLVFGRHASFARLARPSRLVIRLVIRLIVSLIVSFLISFLILILIPPLVIFLLLLRMQCPAGVRGMRDYSLAAMIPF